MRSFNPQRLLRKELENLCCPHGFSNAVGFWLAFFTGQQGANLVAPRQQFHTYGFQHIGPLLRRGATPAG